MPYSEANGVVFIWIPKTGGTSVARTLRKHGIFQKNNKSDLWGRIPQEERRRWGGAAHWHHLTVEGVKEHIGGETWERCFSFAFVRNPWDWVVSFYEYSKGARSNRNSIHFGRPSVGSIGEWFERMPPRPQLAHLQDEDGRIPLNFIGRFETLQEDFDKLCSRLSLPELTLPRFKASKRGDYHQYFTTALRNKVAKAYEKEIEIFKYVF